MIEHRESSPEETEADQTLAGYSIPPGLHNREQPKVLYWSEKRCSAWERKISEGPTTPQDPHWNDFWNKTVRDGFPRNGGPTLPVFARCKDTLDDSFSNYKNYAGQQLEEVTQAISPKLCRVFGISQDSFKANPEQVVLTDNTTHGTGIIFRSFADKGGFKDGGELLITDREHSTLIAKATEATKAGGGKVSVAKLPDTADASSDDLYNAIIKSVTPQTKMIAVSHIDYLHGVQLPIERLAKFCSEHNIWLHIDGAQSFGMLPIDKILPTLPGRCSYSANGNKWMNSWGTCGVLWSSPEAVKELKTGASESKESFYHDPWRLYREATGSRSTMDICALDTALDVYLSLGPERVWSRVQQITHQLREGIRGIPSIRMVDSTKEGCNSGLVRFKLLDTINGVKLQNPFDEAYQLGEEFKKRGIPARAILDVGTPLIGINANLSRTTRDIEKYTEIIREVLEKRYPQTHLIVAKHSVTNAVQPV